MTGFGPINGYTWTTSFFFHREFNFKPLHSRQPLHGERYYFLEIIYKKFGKDLTGKLFGIWGLSFKPQTDDMREAPAKVIVPALIDSGAKLLACDPVATGQAKSIFGKYNEGIKYVDNM
ncbi:hypothetical protein M1N12_03225, partial [Peptococcaceae bacterium]|nr:hypothetical protein [Peptococcaceae bacterium]